MGNTLGTPQEQRTLDYYLTDLEVTYQDNLGGSRFLKSMKGAHAEGAVVVKVYVKRGRESGDSDLTATAERVQDIKQRLAGAPNLCPSQRAVETEKAGFLIRQYFYASLYDRVSTRPFFTHMEKKWIAFQVLQAVAQSHAAGVCHGDIKSENVMITSWGWSYLTDFASYKPAYLPDDNPADFSYYFNSSGRRTCYVAPERFFNTPERPSGDLVASSDIFSAGCVLAELFLDGRQLFDLGGLFSYRKGEYDPRVLLDDIKDDAVRELVMEMTRLDPAQRKTASELIERWQGELFPPYFASYLHPFMAELAHLDADDRITRVYTEFPKIVEALVGINCPPLSASHPRAEDVLAQASNQEAPAPLPSGGETSAVLGDTYAQLMDTERFIRTLESDRTPIASDVAPEPSQRPTVDPIIKSTSSVDPRLITPLPSDETAEGKTITLRTSEPPEPTLAEEVPGGPFPQMIMIASTVCSSIRDAVDPITRLRGLELLLQIGRYVDDEGRLQLLVPYCVALLGDQAPLVRASSIFVLSSLLTLIHRLSVQDAHIFPDYILPSLSMIPNDPESIVRVSLAKHIPALAECSQRFLDMAQTLHATDGSATTQPSYDEELSRLRTAFSDVAMLLLTSQDTATKRALMLDTTRLCLFLGQRRTNDFLLPMLITLLNDRDWEIRAAFFHNLVGICAFVGRTSLEDFILPLLMQALTDEEEFVVEKAINTLASLCELGLFRREPMLKVARKLAPFLCHPSKWLRFSTVAFACATARQLSFTDVHCFVIPILSPFLKREIADVNESSLLEALLPQVTRTGFDRAVGLCIEAQQVAAEGKDDEQPPIVDQLFPGKHAFVGLPEEEGRVLTAMAPCIRMIASAMQAKSRLWELENLERMRKGERGVLEEYMRLSTSIPIYSVEIEGQEPASGSRRSKVNSRSRVVEDTAMVPLVDNETVRSRFPGIPDTVPPDVGRIAMARAREGTPSANGTADGAGQDVADGGGGGGAADTPLLPIESLRGWRPVGQLVAHLHEHEEAVNRVCVAEDSMFFVTGSDDGTVKVWDCQRLEKNVANRSRLTYRQGGHVRDLTICRGTHTVASAGTDGSIHVFKIDRHAGMSTLRGVDVADEGSIMCVSHHVTDGYRSLLVCATQRGWVHAWDTRQQREAWSFRSDPRLGLLQALDVDAGSSWMTVGTARGFVSYWDIRFQVLAQSWRHPGQCRIHRTRCFRAPEGRTWLLLTADDSADVSAWDVETGQCRLVLRVLPSGQAATQGQAPEALPVADLMDYGTDDLKRTSVTRSSTRAVFCPPDSGFVITGGTDRKLRYWDLNDATSSFVVSGLAHDEAKPIHVPHIGDTFSMVQEVQNSTSEDVGRALSRPRGGPMPPSVGHLDAILDIHAMTVPSRMLVSGGRDGIVKVWK